MFERFDGDARRGIVAAQELARTRGEDVGVAHLVIGAVSEGGLDAFEDLEQDEVVAALTAGLGEGGGPSDENPRFARDAKKALELSLREALRAGSNRIRPHHLVLGCLRCGDPVVDEAFKDHPIGDPPDERRRRRRARRVGMRTGNDVTEGAQRFFRSIGSVVSVHAPEVTGRALGTHHLLLGLLDDQTSMAARVLADLGVTKETVEARIAELGTAGTSDEDPRAKALQSELTDVVERLGELDPAARTAAAARLRQALEQLEAPNPGQ